MTPISDASGNVGDAKRGQRTVFATAGHVDHGKTRLIQALTGKQTDRLAEEKRRGISIELGFAELAEQSLSFIDVPGHRQLVHTMIAGTGGVDAVLLVVAADDGVMPQTREHLSICQLLGVQRIVVALNKTDLVDSEIAELARLEIEQCLSELGLEALSIISVSAERGDGVAELKAALIECAKSVSCRSRSQLSWLSIDRVFSIKGAGTVVTGTLIRGSLAQGQEVHIVGPAGVESSACREIEVHGEKRTEALAPCRVAVNLARLSREQVARGQVLTSDKAVPCSRYLDVALTTLPEVGHQLDDRKPVMVHVGTTRRAGRIVWWGDGFAHLILDEAMPCTGGQGVILRGFSGDGQYGAVLAGGSVLDAAAPAMGRRREARRRLRIDALTSLAVSEFGSALMTWLELSRPQSLDPRLAERRFGMEPGEARSALRSVAPDGEVVTLRDGCLTSAANISDATQRAVTAVQAHHEQHPDEAAMSLESLRERLARSAGRVIATLAVTCAEQTGALVRTQSGVSTPEFAELRDTSALTGVLLAAIESAAYQGQSERVLLGTIDDSPVRVRSALAELQSRQLVRRLSDLWFSEGCLAELRRSVQDHFSRSDLLSVADMKALLGVGRKQAIPLLEQLDREGTTQRKGNDRVAGKGLRPLP
ncbi:MAG: selenocysteine-specific translation elongation factor [Polyangiaceae bacterium]|nr:selenocysteine-specific translation elongation factor [Polyangiaceae bacterium]